MVQVIRRFRRVDKTHDRNFTADQMLANVGRSVKYLEAIKISFVIKKSINHRSLADLFKRFG